MFETTRRKALGAVAGVAALVSVPSGVAGSSANDVEERAQQPGKSEQRTGWASGSSGR